MKQPLRVLVVMVFATLVAGAIGGAAGVVYGQRVTHPYADLDSVIHHDLALSVEQNRQIEALEDKFSERREALHGEMRAANRELADSLESEHAYGARAQAAMDHFHRAEKQLQAATIQHVLAMRAVLTAEQSRKLDRAIYMALTRGA